MSGLLNHLWNKFNVPMPNDLEYFFFFFFEMLFGTKQSLELIFIFVNFGNDEIAPRAAVGFS